MFSLTIELVDCYFMKKEIQWLKAIIVWRNKGQINQCWLKVKVRATPPNNDSNN
jgi:hypothetical protein